MLADLCLKRCIRGFDNFAGVCSIPMFAPELKTELKTLRIEVDDFYQNGCFSINSPKLEYIDINSAGLSNYHLVNANSPVNASIVLRKIYSKHRVEDQLLYLLKHLAALLSQTTGNYLFLEIHDLSLQVIILTLTSFTVCTVENKIAGGKNDRNITM